MIASGIIWTSPMRLIALSRNEVHIWRLELNQPSSCLDKSASNLSRKERTRAASFRFETHRNRFILCHGALRTILGLYLNTEPDRLDFCYNNHGKPCLSDRFFKDQVQFNLAHSDDLAICAFAKGRNVGIDLEHVHNIPDVEELAASFFPKQESKRLQMLPSDQKTRAFFRCWTRREAYGKAKGTGLIKESNQCEALLAPEEFPCLLGKTGNGKSDRRWSAISFTPAPEYTAALVVEGHGWQTRFFRFSF